MKCKKETDGRAFDHHTRQVMRQQAVKAVFQGSKAPRLQGSKAASLTAALGVNIRTVFRRLAEYTNGVQRALLAKPIPGRAPKLSGE